MVARRKNAPVTERTEIDARLERARQQIEACGFRRVEHPDGRISFLAQPRESQRPG